MSQAFQAQPPNPHAAVEMDGQVWDSFEHTGLFSTVRVELTTDQASEVSWSINDPDFVYIDRYSLPDGIPQLITRVWLGYGRDLGEPLFKGVLARIDRDDTSTTFVFYDMSYKMRLEKRAGYNKGTDLAIMKVLCERNGLIFDAPAGFPGEASKSRITDARTDWEVFSSLAREAGLITYTRGDTVFAREPKTAGLVPVLTLRHRQEFYLLRGNDFSYKLPENQEGSPKSVEVRGRTKDGKLLRGKSAENKRGRVDLSIKKDIKHKTTAGAKRRAEAKKAMEREHAFTCRIKTTVAETVRADVLDAIRIEGAGKLFSGTYICDSVGYDFGARGLTRNYNLHRDITGV